jgi:hypothetical protein
MAALKKRTVKRSTDRGRLVKKHWEGKPADEYHDALGTKAKGRGIYVLYQKGTVYYVGLSLTSLRGRLRAHATKDRHKGLWDSYSFYQIGRTRFIKDVESLLLKIVQPPGNRVRGRFRSRHNLSKR